MPAGEINRRFLSPSMTYLLFSLFLAYMRKFASVLAMDLELRLRNLQTGSPLGRKNEWMRNKVLWEITNDITYSQVPSFRGWQEPTCSTSPLSRFGNSGVCAIFCFCLMVAVMDWSQWQRSVAPGPWGKRSFLLFQICSFVALVVLHPSRGAPPTQTLWSVPFLLVQ